MLQSIPKEGKDTTCRHGQNAAIVTVDSGVDQRKTQRHYSLPECGEDDRRAVDRAGGPNLVRALGSDVADNSSTDGTFGVVGRFEDRLPYLRIVDAPRRKGSAYARNIGAPLVRME